MGLTAKKIMLRKVTEAFEVFCLRGSGHFWERLRNKRTVFAFMVWEVIFRYAANTSQIPAVKHQGISA